MTNRKEHLINRNVRIGLIALTGLVASVALAGIIGYSTSREVNTSSSDSTYFPPFRIIGYR